LFYEESFNLFFQYYRFLFVAKKMKISHQ